MKYLQHNLHVIRMFRTASILWLACVAMLPCRAVQLNGAYTIDPAATASSTNFKDFTSAIAYLTGSGSRPDAGPSNSAPFGVSGPVVFMVASGTYNITSMIDVPAVPGTSDVNTVTFDGGNGNASSRVITGTLAGTAVFAFNGCNYVGIRNLTINNTAGTNTTYSGVGIVGSASSTVGTGCFVNNCVINLPNSNANYLTYGITVTPSASGNGAGVTWVDSLRIDSNTVNGSYYAFQMQGPNTISNARNRDIKVRGNRFLNAHYFGIRITYVQNGIDILNNTVSMNPTTGTNALYLYYCYNHFSGNASHRIIGNKFIGGVSNQIGNVTGLNTAPTQLHANMVMNLRMGTNFGFAIYNGSGQNGAYEVYHNTINISQASGGYGLHFHAPAGASFIKNNIFAVTHASSTATPLHIATTLSGNVVNYNIYYNKASSTLMYRTGVTLYPTTYRTAAAGGDSSFNFLPDFIQNDTNLHLVDGCSSTGVNLNSTVPRDADGDAYISAPHIGADQVPRLGTDMSVIRFVTPQAPITTGSQDVIFTVKNLGLNAILWFDAGYKLNTTAAVTNTISTTLNSCDTLQVVFSGGQQASLIHLNDLRVFTAAPNSTTDSNAVNDTVRATLLAPLNGTYTIGGTTPDFPGFAEAVDALHYGITGPVTFLVAPGTYTGQVNITGPIPGSDPTNTITFDGIDKATRTLSYNAAASPAVVKISAKYVTIRNFTITATNPTSGIGVFIAQGAHCCGIKSCNITVPAYPAMTCLGVLIGGLETNYTNGYARVDSLEIDSNTISNGYLGIVCDNRYNYNSISLLNKIRNNRILNSHSAGIYLYAYQNGTSIGYNTVVPSQANPSNDGIFLYQLKNHTAAHPLVISGNKVFNYGYRGIVLNGCENTASGRGLLINNMVGGGQRWGYASCLRMTESHNWLVLNNSFNATYSTFGREYGAMYSYLSFGLTICNNLFAVSTSSPGLPMYLVASSPDTMDHNIFYKADTTDHVVVKWDTIEFNSANFKGAGGHNANSMYDIPGFASDTDLHVLSACRRGMSFPSVTSDADGETRASLPAIGADEVPSLNNDVALEMLVAPVYPITAGLQDVVARIRNTGSNTITSFSLSYKLNSNAPVSISWTGSLSPCDTVTLTFTGSNQLNIPSTGRHSLKVYTHNPNGLTDPTRVNDTVSRIVGAPLNGIYTVGAAPSDFTTLRDVVVALNDLGTTGPVTFNIRTGTYSDSLRLTNIAGVTPASPVVFRSVANHRDSVTITNNGNVTIRLEASHISFRNLSIVQQSNFGTAIQTRNVISGDTFYNCRISAPVSSTPDSYTLKSEATISNSLFRKCLFNGSYYGIMIAPLVNGARATNCVFDSNTLQNAWYSPMYIINGTVNLKIRNNDIRCNGPYNHVWCNLQRCDSAFEFSGNLVTPGGTVDIANFVFSNNTGHPAARIKISGNRFLSVGNTMVRPSFTENAQMDIFNNEMLAKFGTVTLGSSSSNVRFFHNTINSKNAALTVNQSSCANVEIRNNILSNTGGGSAVTFAPQPLSSGVQMDGNNLYSSGAVLVYWAWLSAGPIYADLNAWRAISGYEMNSVSYRPPFINDTSNLAPNINDSAAWAVNGRGIPTTWIDNDLNGNPRSTEIRTGPVDLGAHEFTPAASCLAPNAIAVPATPAQAISSNGGLQVFTFAYDTVAKINWSLASTPPASITYKRYSGVLPRHIGDTTGLSYMYVYDDVNADSVGAFSYTLNLHYRHQWLGNTSNEANLIVAKKHSYAPWSSGILSGSTVDTARNVLSSTPQTSFSLFTGTESSAPLPVALINLGGKRHGKDVQLTWLTSGESNSEAFVIERSADGLSYERAGTVAAAGFSSHVLSYNFNDANAFSKPVPVLYYRLMMTDRDGAYRHSNTVRVLNSETRISNVNIYPNPFSSEVVLNIETAAAGNVSLEIHDIHGKLLHSQTTDCRQGSNAVMTKGLASLHPGIYFATVTTDAESRVIKVIKE